MSTAQVLIVGAGPTGLTLACGLRIQGVSVTVIDAATGPATTSRALALQPRGVEVLDRLRALGDLPERSLPAMSMNLKDGDRTFLHVDLGGPAVTASGRKGHPILLISQAEIEGELRRRLADLGTEVVWGTELRDVDPGDDGTTVTLRGSDGATSTARASWVVGCDGAHSMVRKRVGITFPGEQIMERALLADVRADWPFDRSGSNSWISSGEMVALMPLPDDVWRVFVTPPAGFPDTPSTDEIIQAVGSAVSEVSGQPGTAIRSVEWTSMFRVHRRLADRYRSGRVLLAGDAAHVHSPTGGQGMNTGVGDAENLAWKLGLVIRGRAPAGLLDSYEAERRPVAAAVLNSTTGVTQLLFSDRRVARLIRDRVVAPLARLSVVQRRIHSAMSQLKVGYRRGPLAVGGGRPPGGGPRPGDRVPDVACRRDDGTSTRLHAELNGGWVVLAADAATARAVAAPAVKRFGDDAVTTLTPDRSDLRAGLRDALLIRPDAHLGWRGAATPEKVEAWLDEVLLRT